MKSYNGFSGAQRERAARWLRQQWDAGRPRPIRCVGCGQTEGVLDAHAEDYSEPFGDHTDRYPLCYRCHMMVHCRFGARAAWNEYRMLVRRGGRLPGFQTRAFGQFRQQHLIGGGWNPEPHIEFDGIKRTVLDAIEAGTA